MGGEAHARCLFDRANGTWHFSFGSGGTKVRFSTSIAQCAGDIRLAGILCRRCFNMMAEGATKTEAEEYRDSIYAKVKDYLGGLFKKKTPKPGKNGESKKA